jgi:hypothetical protein
MSEDGRHAAKRTRVNISPTARTLALKIPPGVEVDVKVELVR